MLWCNKWHNSSNLKLNAIYHHNHSPSLASGWSHCLKLSWKEGEGGDWVLRCTQPQSCGGRAQSLGWRCWTPDAPGWLSPQMNSGPGCFVSRLECWECRRWAAQGPEAVCLSRCFCWVWHQNKVSGGRSEARLNLQGVCHRRSLTFCDMPSCGWWWRGAPGWRCSIQRPQCQSLPPGRCSRRWRWIHCGPQHGDHTSVRWSPESSYTCKSRMCSGTGLRWHRGSWYTHRHHSGTWTVHTNLVRCVGGWNSVYYKLLLQEIRIVKLVILNNSVSLVHGFELKADKPVSLEACFTLTYWTIQTVDTLPTVFTGVVSAVRSQLTPEFKTSFHEQPKSNTSADSIASLPMWNICILWWISENYMLLLNMLLCKRIGKKAFMNADYRLDKSKSN